MGGNFSQMDTSASLLSFIQQEYEKARGKPKRDYLVLSDLLTVSLPADYTFNFCHIGTLFCMDANKDGRFSMEDFGVFAELALA